MFYLSPLLFVCFLFVKHALYILTDSLRISSSKRITQVQNATHSVTNKPSVSGKMRLMRNNKVSPITVCHGKMVANKRMSTNFLRYGVLLLHMSLLWMLLTSFLSLLLLLHSLVQIVIDSIKYKPHAIRQMWLPMPSAINRRVILLFYDLYTLNPTKHVRRKIAEWMKVQRW